MILNEREVIFNLNAFCRLRSIATHRDIFSVICLSVRLSVRLSHFSVHTFPGNTCIPGNAATILYNVSTLSTRVACNVKLYKANRALFLEWSFTATNTQCYLWILYDKMDWITWYEFDMYMYEEVTILIPKCSKVVNKLHHFQEVTRFADLNFDR